MENSYLLIQLSGKYNHRLKNWQVFKGKPDGEGIEG